MIYTNIYSNSAEKKIIFGINLMKILMKKQILILTCCIALFGCNGAQPEIEQEKETIVTEVVQDDELPKLEDAEPIVSLTQSEAKELLKKYLKDNPGVYPQYGEIVDIHLVGGKYTKDEVLDYFYYVEFVIQMGGGTLYPAYFFYNSEVGKIEELTESKKIDFIYYIDVKEISSGKLIGAAKFHQDDGSSGEFSASRSVKAEFKIEGNKITCDEKYLPAFKKAQKEIQKELEKMEREMMEEADAYNSEGY